MMIGRPDGKMAMITDGKVSITDAPTGMPALDQRIADELLAHLRLETTNIVERRQMK